MGDLFLLLECPKLSDHIQNVNDVLLLAIHKRKGKILIKTISIFE
jgi:hypothetical protein